MSPSTPDSVDARVTGTRVSRTIDDCPPDLEIASESGSVDVTVTDPPATVQVTGEGNSVTVRGRGPVELVAEGGRNSITVAEAVELTLDNRGTGNAIDREQFDDGPDLVRKSREEAYADLGWFGYDAITYQSTADEREFCHSCGTDTDNIVHRHTQKVLKVLWFSLTVGDRTTVDECEECTVPERDLSSVERKDIFG
jgi:hypothetical protein